MKMKTRAKGFTLIEAVIALAIFSVISVGAFQVWRYASGDSLSTLARAEAFENARAAMDALLINLQLADEITLKTNANGNLTKLTLRELDPEGRYHDYVFDYYPSAPKGASKYRKLDFGYNEFASGISEVSLTENEGLLLITVSAGAEAAKPITLESAADIRHKLFNES